MAWTTFAEIRSERKYNKLEKILAKNKILYSNIIIDMGVYLPCQVPYSVFKSNGRIQGRENVLTFPFPHFNFFIISPRVCKNSKNQVDLRNGTKCGITDFSEILHHNLWVASNRWMASLNYFKVIRNFPWHIFNHH